MDPHREEYVDKLYKWYLIQCKSRKITPKAGAKIGARLLGVELRHLLENKIKKEFADQSWLSSEEKELHDPMRPRPIAVHLCMREVIKEALTTCKIKAKFGANGDISYKMSVWDKVKLWFVISFIIDYIENLLSD